MLAIDVSELSKTYYLAQKDPGVFGSLRALFKPRYKEKVAVDGISFAIQPGEVVGYIGVNGAGKSTTIKMLTGILAPSSGTIRILGRDPHGERIANARDIGVVFGQRTQLWWDLALVESLNLVAKIYEVPQERYKRLLAQFSDELKLADLLNVPIRSMSLGQKMRSELAATLIHEPKVVYLDEPTIGLDLVVKERIREFIKQQNRERGTTIVLTTHDLGDIEELCQRVLIIDAGKLIYDGPLSTIRERFGAHREITFETSSSTETVSLPLGATLLSREAHKLVLRFDRRQTSASKVAAAVMGQLEVTDFTLTEPDLGSIIKQIYGGALSHKEVKV